MNTHLFDLTSDSPEDVTPKRKGRKTACAGPATAAVSLPAPAPERQRAIRPIGLIDSEPCLGRAFGLPCLCTLRDIYYEEQGDWQVGCFVCGEMSWMPAVEGYLNEKPQGAEFVIRDGRFAGMRLDEIVEQPRGLDTLRIYAKTHKSDVVRREVGKFLDSQPAGR